MRKILRAISVVVAALLVSHQASAQLVVSGQAASNQIAPTGVTPGTYTCPQVTVNAQGQVTSITNGSCGSSSSTASALDTHLSSGNTGLDVWTTQINASNSGLAAFPRASTLPINPSGSIPFSLTFAGDAWGGDVYCLAEPNYDYVTPGAWGCIYGKAVNGNRRGPIIYQSNKVINADDGTGGPGMIMWADRPNADQSGNQGYMDIWAWGNSASAYSNTISFGNRDGAGTPHRRFRILNNGSINLPDLAGSGLARLCIDGSGTLVRGGC